jgi:hypothetical protein
MLSAIPLLLGLSLPSSAQTFQDIECKKTVMSIGGGNYTLHMVKTGDTYRADYTFESFGPTPAFSYRIEGTSCRTTPDHEMLFACRSDPVLTDPQLIPPFGSATTRLITYLDIDTVRERIELQFEYTAIKHDAPPVIERLELEFETEQCSRR